MSKIISHYVCKECGRVEDTNLVRCPQCGAEGSFERCIYSREETPKSIARSKRCFPSNITSEPIKKLTDIEVGENVRFSTGLCELDRVLGGGIMKGSSILLGGEPGIGKSTLMLQAVANIAREHSILYISGEETDTQVKLRAERLGVVSDKIRLFSSTKLASIVDVLWRERPEVIVIDSLQTLSVGDIDSAPGTQSQIKACTAALTETIKILGITMFIIAHINKDGAIAGPKFAEHLVDTVMYFENAEGLLRIVRTTKNRYGSSDEVGVFIMGEKGLLCVEDPSLAFAVEREGKVPSGIVNTAVVEGTRAMIVEIQVLCTNSKGQTRRVFSDKIDVSCVQRTIAILEEQVGINLGFNDIYVNVAGGIRLTDPSIEVPLAVAIYTSCMGIELNKKTVFYGELTLRGEVRRSPFVQKRNRTAKSMGFECAVYYGNEEGQENEIQTMSISKLDELKTIIDKINEEN